MTVSKRIAGIPVLGKFLVKVKKAMFGQKAFPGSANYWETRYAQGGNSGAGSYGVLAEHKADVINTFVAEQGIDTVIEFGCGDGNQLSLGRYPNYIGLDISPTIIRQCLARFETDKTKSFFVYDTLAFRDRHQVFKADMSMSLDVLYHLIEDEIFEKYMHHLFDSASRYVLIFSSNFHRGQDFHEIDRVFTKWVEKNRPDWKLSHMQENKYKPSSATNDPINTSKADFYFFVPNR